MKKQIFFILFSLLFLGCKPKQALTEKHIEISKQHDSTVIASKIKVNQAINDSLKVVIGKISTQKKECDSVCQATVDRLLSQLNSRKQSGNNSAGVFYDTITKTITVYNRVGQTQDSVSSKIRTQYKDKLIYLDRPIEVEKPLAKWQLFLMYFGVAALTYSGIKIAMFAKRMTA